MVRWEGFEPPTLWFVARYSIQLSYQRVEAANYGETTCSRQHPAWKFSRLFSCFTNEIERAQYAQSLERQPLHKYGYRSKRKQAICTCLKSDKRPRSTEDRATYTRHTNRQYLLKNASIASNTTSKTQAIQVQTIG
jgi:hypothetical protein